MDKRGWDFLCPRMKQERAEKVLRYAEQYFEPALIRFPELCGKVYLSLRKYGWLAKYDPVLHIVIRESALNDYSPSRIRATTAHELMHLIQFSNGIGLGRDGTRDVERQATFLSFARGFAYDFLCAFPESCGSEVCAHEHRICYYSCSLIFKGCCRDYTEDELREKSDALTALTQSYGLKDNPDYFGLVGRCMLATN